MKYIKTYEDINKYNYKVGDHVVIIKTFKYRKDLKKFLKNNVGEIYKIGAPDEDNIICYFVRYFNVPEEVKCYALYYLTGTYVGFPFLKSDMRLATKEEIEYQELKNNMIKYNL